MVKAARYVPHARGLLVLGLPLIGSHIAQIVIGITDAMMLGWYDADALAAVTLGHSTWFIFFIVGSGFAMAVMPMVASAAAAGEPTQVRRVTRMGMWLSVLYGAAVMVPLFWSEALLLAIDQPPKIAALAQTYLRFAALGMVPALLVMVLKSYLSALERTQPVLWITVSTAVLNAALNYVLIFGNFGAPELGLEGAAIASVAVHVGGLIAFCLYAARVTPEHRLFSRIWRIDTGAFAQVFRLGWPIGLTVLCEAGLFSASAIMMGWLGALPLAAHGVALQLASLSFVLHLGLSQAATVRAGTAYARRDFVSLREGGQTAMLLSLGFALVTMFLFLAIPQVLVGAFIDPTDPAQPEILAIGVGLLAVAAAFQVVDGLQVVALGLLRGLQDMRAPMWVAAFSYWAIGAPVGYYLGIALG
ncbi:MAG: MATE family efflux transporter, partial [Pseudomonadota bacterium]